MCVCCPASCRPLQSRPAHMKLSRWREKSPSRFSSIVDAESATMAGAQQSRHLQQDQISLLFIRFCAARISIMASPWHLLSWCLCSSRVGCSFGLVWSGRTLSTTATKSLLAFLAGGQRSCGRWVEAGSLRRMLETSDAGHPPNLATRD